MALPRELLWRSRAGASPAPTAQGNRPPISKPIMIYKKSRAVIKRVVGQRAAHGLRVLIEQHLQVAAHLFLHFRAV